MKKSILVAASVAILLGVSAVALSAQSLLDNDFYKQAKDQLAQGDQAMQAGDYDTAASLAAQAKENFAKSDEYVATMMMFYRANGWLSQAKDRIAYAKSIKADTNYKDAYATAVTDAGGAKDALDAKDYDKSIGLSKDAIAALANIGPVTAKAPPPPAKAEPASRSTTRCSSSFPSGTASGGSRDSRSSTTIPGSGDCCTMRTSPSSANRTTRI